MLLALQLQWHIAAYIIPQQQFGLALCEAPVLWMLVYPLLLYSLTTAINQHAKARLVEPLDIKGAFWQCLMEGPSRLSLRVLISWQFSITFIKTTVYTYQIFTLTSFRHIHSHTLLPSGFLREQYGLLAYLIYIFVNFLLLWSIPWLWGMG